MNESSNPTRRYAWPKYVWGAVILGVIISVLAMVKEARRVQRMKQSDPLWSAPAAPGESR